MTQHGQRRRHNPCVQHGEHFQIQNCHYPKRCNDSFVPPSPGPPIHPSVFHRQIENKKPNYVCVPCPDFFKTTYDLKNDLIIHLTRENQYTKPCNNVYPLRNGRLRFSSCSKSDCTYAHSISEFRIKICSHDMNCYKFQNNKTKFMCPYIHSVESGYDWIRRTAGRIPLLPLERTRLSEKEQLDYNMIKYDEYKDFLDSSNYFTDVKQNKIDIITTSKYAEKSLEFALEKGMTNISIKICKDIPSMVFDFSSDETESEEDY